MTSYGIALIRRNSTKERYELLLVRRRTSYAFLDFVKGRYRKSDVRELFRNMTCNERMIISTMDFQFMWMQANMSMPNFRDKGGRDKYGRLHSTFRRNWSRAAELRQYLSECTGNKPLWEIPKGRANHKELPMTAAMREMVEETGISKHTYRILSTSAYNYSFSDRGETYRYKYYLAQANSSARLPRINFNNRTQVREVIDRQWFGIEEIRHLGDKHLTTMATAIFSIVKKRYRGAGDDLPRRILGDWRVSSPHAPVISV